MVFAAVIIVLAVFVMEDPVGRALDLMEEEQFTAAAALFDSLHTEAETDLIAYLEKRPDHAHTHLMLGWLLARRGLEEEAGRHMVTADSLQPGILEPYVKP